MSIERAGEQLPEKVVLQCDAPDCTEEGEWCEVMVAGKRYEMILGPKHQKPLLEVAEWGRPVRSSRQVPKRNRDTGTARLEGLIRRES